MTTTAEKPLPLEVQHVKSMVNEAVREVLRKTQDATRRAAILQAFHAGLDEMAATLEQKFEPSKPPKAAKSKKVASDV